VQALSGTGALRLAAEFIKAQLSTSDVVAITNPTWVNHRQIFHRSGFQVEDLPYWDKCGKCLDIKGFLSGLDSLPEKSVCVFHASAHNPTGVDPTEEQWLQILDVVKRRRHVVVMDCAYQGYASGDLDQDAAPIRLFERNGIELSVCQSFAKNMGLYGERIGALHIVCSDFERSKCVLSQLKPLIRSMYSNPPSHGARIVTRILAEKENYENWKIELKSVAERIKSMRQQLNSGLSEKLTPGNWSHICDQIGMFSFTGLTEEQCEMMTSQRHVYMLKNGRISMAGLNRSNIQWVVDSINMCVRLRPSDPR